MLELIRPSVERADEYLQICSEYGEVDKSNHIHIDSIEKAKERIERDLLLEDSEILPIGRVRQFVRWAQNEEEIILGTCRIRIELNEKLREKGGHIGYDVRPIYRKKGIGTEILKYALIELWEKCYEDALVTCDDDNIGSYRIIENNNGILENKIFDEESGKLIRRYIIKRNN